jgi:hypothetical protein
MDSNALEDQPILPADGDIETQTQNKLPSARNRLLRYGAIAASLVLAALMGSYVVFLPAWTTRTSSKQIKAGGVVGLMSGSDGDPTAVGAAEESDAAPPLPKAWNSIPNMVFVTEGPDVGQGSGTPEACQAQCDADPKCFSFSRCGATCFFKGLSHTGREPQQWNGYCESFWLANGYFPWQPTLLEKNPDPPLTFYMYMATSKPSDGSFYPPANNNAASLAGVLWYLHNEVVKTCDGSGFLASGGAPGDRKFGIALIRRVKITMKTTLPLKAAGMKFGPLQSFDSGETTGPHLYSALDGVGTGFVSTKEWADFGFNVGCGYLGEWPHDTEPGGWTSGTSYPDCIWYSLPGPCPEMRRADATQSCKISQPGGLCASPTGQGNCTYAYEDAGFIDIDTLVGIKPKWSSRKEYCEECKVEGGPYVPPFEGTCGLDFWGPNIWTDKSGDTARVQKALDAFEAKYPKCTGSKDDVEYCTDESFTGKPPCEFNKAAYEQAGGAVFQGR